MDEKEEKKKDIWEIRKNFILLIDDDLETIEFLKNTLSSFPYELKVSTKAEEGFTLAEEINPAGIILSADLKKGFTVCSKLKKDENLKKIPTVLTSSMTDEKIFKDHSNLPIRADAYLLKPFDKEKFLKTFIEIIAKEEVEKTREISIEEIPDRTLISQEVISSAVVSYVDDEIKSLKNIIEEMSAERTKLNEKIQILEQELENAKGKIDSQITSLRETSAEKNKMELLSKEMEKLRIQINALEVERNSIVKEKETLSVQLTKEEMENREMEEERKKLQEEIEKLKEDLESRTEIFSRLEEGYKETNLFLEENNKTLMGEMDDLREKLQKVEKEKEELQEYCEKLKLSEVPKEEIEKLYSEIEKLKALEEENIKLKEENKRLEEIEILKDKINEYEKEKEGMMMKINEIMEQKDALVDSIREKDNKILEFEGKIQELESKLKKIKSFFNELNF